MRLEQLQGRQHAAPRKEHEVPQHEQSRHCKVEAAEQQVNLGMPGPAMPQRKLASSPKTASWPADWTATETANMVINQGGVPSKDGSEICCQSDFSTQCQVQIQYQSGVRYYDHTNQRSRFEDPINGIEVDDYKAHKAMLVRTTALTSLPCCPIDPRDTLDAGKTVFLDDNATPAWQGHPPQPDC